MKLCVNNECQQTCNKMFQIKQDKNPGKLDDVLVLVEEIRILLKNNIEI